MLWIKLLKLVWEVVCLVFRCVVSSETRRNLAHLDILVLYKQDQTQSGFTKPNVILDFLYPDVDIHDAFGSRLSKRLKKD